MTLYSKTNNDTVYKPILQHFLSLYFFYNIYFIEVINSYFVHFIQVN